MLHVVQLPIGLDACICFGAFGAFTPFIAIIISVIVVIIIIITAIAINTTVFTTALEDFVSTVDI